MHQSSTSLHHFLLQLALQLSPFFADPQQLPICLFQPAHPVALLLLASLSDLSLKPLFLPSQPSQSALALLFLCLQQLNIVFTHFVPLHLKSNHHQFFHQLAGLLPHIFNLFFCHFLQHCFSDFTVFFVHSYNPLQRSILKHQQLILLIELLLHLHISLMLEKCSFSPIFLDCYGSSFQPDGKDVVNSKLCTAHLFESSVFTGVTFDSVSDFC